jgi:hypothetical protein
VIAVYGMTGSPSLPPCPPSVSHFLASWRHAQAVIAVSLWGLAGGESFIFLRVFRAFRVMRLFKKLQPMRKILISLGACVKPVLGAFVILFILASIYAQVLSFAWYSQ